AQLFLYEAKEPHEYSRHGTGLQHLAFMVSTRAEVERACEWARDRGDEIVRAPKAFPHYGPHQFATFILDPHGFMIEVVTHESVDPDQPSP
ncbi:MAG: VOC family protein, partial [Acidimicrobiia bacterium]